MARTFAGSLGYRTRTFPLYQEVTARDLLQRRITEADSSSHIVASSAAAHEESTVHFTSAASSASLSSNQNSSDVASMNKTSWVDSPLIAAARNGDLCVLDGVDRW